MAVDVEEQSDEITQGVTVKALDACHPEQREGSL